MVSARFRLQERRAGLIGFSITNYWLIVQPISGKVHLVLTLHSRPGAAPGEAVGHDSVHTPHEDRFVPRSNALGARTDDGACGLFSRRTRCNYHRITNAQRGRDTVLVCPCISISLRKRTERVTAGVNMVCNGKLYK